MAVDPNKYSIYARQDADKKYVDWGKVAQDVTKGRKTEVTLMNGYISEQGALLGISTPINTAITSVVDEIDRGLRKADVENIKEVLLRAGIT